MFSQTAQGRFTDLSLNSQVSSWFYRTNDPLICPCPVLNVGVSQKWFKGLPLKFYFRPFGDIHWNRKWNLKSAVNRKRQPEIVFTVNNKDFKAWGMTWASQIGLIMCYFLTIYTLGSGEPAWNLRGQLFWNLTVNTFDYHSSNLKIIYEIYFTNPWKAIGKIKRAWLKMLQRIWQKPFKTKGQIN